MPFERLLPVVNSTARKFARDESPDLFSESAGNFAHISSGADDAKSVSIAVDAVAKAARESLARGDIGSISLAAAENVGSAGAGPAFDGALRIAAESSGERLTALSAKKAGEPPTNRAVPDLDYVELVFDPSKGVGDGFYSRLVFSVQTAQLSSIKMIRIFRSVLDNSQLSRNTRLLSLRGIEKITTAPPRTTDKSLDSIASRSAQLSVNGVRNFVTEMLPTNPLTGLRSSPDGDRPTEPAVDRSVVDDMRLSSRFGSSVSVMDTSVLVGKSIIQKDTVARVKSVATAKKSAASNIVVERTNFDEFSEIGYFSLDGLKSRQVGPETEFSFEDRTVQFGRSYRYFVTTVDSAMRSSARSQISQLNVEHVAPVSADFSVLGHTDSTRVILSISCTDRMIEKFEVYRYGADATAPISVVLGSDGHSFSSEKRPAIPNGIAQVGEAMADPGSGGVFVDSDVVPGNSYRYRIHAVDFFGNKTSEGKDVKVFFGDASRGKNDLRAPVILGEQDSKTGYAKLTLANDDPRVTMLRVRRRDMTLRQHGFTTPSQPIGLTMGQTDVKSHPSSEGARLYSDDLSWNGHIFVTGSVQMTFIDKLVDIDHVYQYSVDGVDSFGRATSTATSRPIFVSRRPMIESPVQLVARYGASSSDEGLFGVSLSWTDSNLDISPQDRIGNREDLANTSVRSLFQIERREINEDRWQEFPLVEGNSYEDHLASSDRPGPSWRPPFVLSNRVYQYRIAVMQTGSYVSNFSDPVTVSTFAPILSPVNFRIVTSEANQRPFIVSLNWDDVPRGAASGEPDTWQIERCHVNSYAAARLDLRDPRQASQLSFTKLVDVSRESSRFRSRVDDESPTPDGSLRLLVGEHHYVDTDIEMGNSYFYRIRAVDAAGNVSPWVYRGANVTSPSFSRKLSNIISQEEKNELSVTLAPMAIVGAYVR